MQGDYPESIGPIGIEIGKKTVGITVKGCFFLSYFRITMYENLILFYCRYAGWKRFDLTELFQDLEGPSYTVLLR